MARDTIGIVTLAPVNIQLLLLPITVQRRVQDAERIITGIQEAVSVNRIQRLPQLLFVVVQQVAVAPVRIGITQVVLVNQLLRPLIQQLFNRRPTLFMTVWHMKLPIGFDASSLY